MRAASTDAITGEGQTSRARTLARLGASRRMPGSAGCYRCLPGYARHRATIVRRSRRPRLADLAGERRSPHSTEGRVLDGDNIIGVPLESHPELKSMLQESSGPDGWSG